MALEHDRPDAVLLAAVIARSQIVVAERAQYAAAARLPAGYDEVDVAVLEWIVADARRARPAFWPM